MTLVERRRSGRLAAWFLRSVLLCALLASPLASFTQEGGSGTIAGQVSRALTAPQLAGGIQGVVIESLRSGEVLYERNRHALLMPASNQKLITTAAALCMLGPDHCLVTRVVARRGEISGGVVRGDLFLVGGGDPFLDEEGIEKLARAVAAAGIRRVQGRIVGDGSVFPGPRYGFGWSWDDMSYYYSAPVSGLNVNRNLLQVIVTPGRRSGQRPSVQLNPAGYPATVRNLATTSDAGGQVQVNVERILGKDVIEVSGTIPASRRGSAPFRTAVTVEDPPLYAAVRLRAKLAAAGVRVEGPAANGVAHKSDLVELASHRSLPISELIARVNKPSDNLGAECLLRAIGLERKESGSVTAGREAVVEWLKTLGMPDNGIVLRDGSGLSRMNYVSADTLVRVLRSMYAHPASAAWLASLPVAGTDGTLRNRLRDTRAAGNCRAKTGYISNVSSLSGYVTTADGEPLLFVMLMNNHPCRNAEATAVQDEIVKLMAEFRRADAGFQAKADQPAAHASPN